MRFSYSSTVRNTVEEVWDFILDFDRRSEWIDFFDKSYITEQTSNWINTKYKEKLTFLGIPLYIEYEIRDYTHQHMMVSQSKMPPFYPVVFITVIDNRNGTITSNLDFEIKLGPFALVPKWLLNKQVDNLVKPSIQRFIKIMDKPNG